jgi:Transposase DDE domain/Domain of unknown function (DUF4372)
MSKNRYFLPHPVFGQLIAYIPNDIITKLVTELRTDYCSKKFRTRDHLLTMLYSCLHQCASIREVIAGLEANASAFSNLKFTRIPRRSTLSDANKHRDAHFFERLFQELFKHYYGGKSDSRFTNETPWAKRLFLLDSSTVTLFSAIMRGAGDKPSDGRAKGGAKVHTLLDAKHDLPSMVHLTEGRESDKVMLKLLALPSYSIITFDKGYRDYKAWQTLTDNQVTWVTRPIGDETFKIVSHKKISIACSEFGVIEDQLIKLGSGINKNVVLDARYVHYKDPETNKELVFVTNNSDLEPSQIALIYKKRWQIEVFFKRLKRHSPLRYFLGDNENAIRIQIWCSLIIDLLIQVIRKQCENKKWSFPTVHALLRQLANSFWNLALYLSNPNLTSKDLNELSTQGKLFESST